jgi:hypothetical protein
VGGEATSQRVTTWCGLNLAEGFYMTTKKTHDISEGRATEALEAAVKPVKCMSSSTPSLMISTVSETLSL